MKISGLRSPHDKINGLMYFGRMLDKARLHASGELPEEYIPNLGSAFDERVCNFLGIKYAEVVERIQRGGTDGEVLEWCCNQGHKPSDEEMEVWNEFMRKRGWNDEASARLVERKAESGFAARDDIQTFFDYIDADEGRK